MSKLFQFALMEYQGEDRDSQDKIIYAYFGLAIYKGQCLEKEFENMLWIKNIFIKKIKSKNEFDSLIDEIEWSKFTMWKQINELSKIYNFSHDVEVELKNILKMRNYLAHNYFKENIQKFWSTKWIKEMLKYFTNFIERASLLDQELQQYSSQYKLKLWITDKQIEKIMTEERNKEKLRDMVN